MSGLAQADPADAELAVVGARPAATTAPVVSACIVLGLALLANPLGSLGHLGLALLLLVVCHFRGSLPLLVLLGLFGPCFGLIRSTLFALGRSGCCRLRCNLGRLGLEGFCLFGLLGRLGRCSGFGCLALRPALGSRPSLFGERHSERQEELEGLLHR